MERILLLIEHKGNRRLLAEVLSRNEEVVVGERFSMQRYTGVPIETRGVACQLDPVSGELVIWVSGQWPHTTRSLAARMLGIARGTLIARIEAYGLPRPRKTGVEPDR